MARRKKIKFRKGTPKKLIEFKAKRMGVKPKGAVLESVAVGSCKKCGMPICQDVFEKYGMYCPEHYDPNVWQGDVREILSRLAR